MRGDLPPVTRVSGDVALTPSQKLRVVLDGISDDRLVNTLCERYHISESEFYDWRETSLAAEVFACASA